MLATLNKSENGYTAIYERNFNQPTQRVWEALTSNDKLKIWMSHLEIIDLSKGGTIIFHHNDGTDNIENMNVTDFENNHVIEFEWGTDIARFEVYQNGTGSKLIMKEIIHELTDHTPKDLAGWHVCLMIFSNVVNNDLKELPENEWEKWYEQYITLVNQYK